ncbi:MAG: flavodoxin family protein [Deltaproteobacteria bacterium]|nr:flavodoxin family protein [Deltaproteobacteria bacterium]
MANNNVKILGICASPRHANTELAVKEALKTAESMGYAETDYVWLGGLDLKPCVGCMKCFGWRHPADGGLECYKFNDDSGMVLHKMLESDGIIFGTPVYTLGVTAIAKILMDKAHMFGPMSFTRYSGTMRNKPCGVITVGGGDSAGQEHVGVDIWAWAIGIGMLPLGSWPTREDPNPQSGSHGAFVTTCDAKGVYAKDGITKEATRTTPPTQGWRNMKAIRNVGRHTAYVAMMTKLGKERIRELGLTEPEVFPWPRYSVKPIPGSWIDKLIKEGKVEYVPKGESSTGLDDQD